MEANKPDIAGATRLLAEALDLPNVSSVDGQARPLIDDRVIRAGNMVLLAQSERERLGVGFSVGIKGLDAPSPFNSINGRFARYAGSVMVTTPIKDASGQEVGWKISVHDCGARRYR